MLALVQRDIAERENLINFVFRERLGDQSSRQIDAVNNIKETEEEDGEDITDIS
jgi:hypothetical protein